MSSPSLFNPFTPGLGPAWILGVGWWAFLQGKEKLTSPGRQTLSASPDPGKATSAVQQAPPGSAVCTHRRDPSKTPALPCRQLTAPALRESWSEGGPAATRHRRLPPGRTPANLRRAPPQPPGARRGGPAPEVPGRPARAHRSSRAERLPPSPGPNGLPSASLPLPAAPPGRGRRPGWARLGPGSRSGSGSDAARRALDGAACALCPAAWHAERSPEPHLPERTGCGRAVA